MQTTDLCLANGPTGSGKLQDPSRPATVRAWGFGLLLGAGLVVFNIPFETMFEGLPRVIPVPPMPATILIGGLMTFFGYFGTLVSLSDLLAPRFAWLDDERHPTRAADNAAFLAVGTLLLPTVLLCTWSAAAHWISVVSG